ncbi:MAG TPA: hypothetical protein PLU24_04540, partial [Candidatus Omnitrophota bacterium]|nr:hypothetical protein [Candidatus Omnitrophota bacterium]
MRKVKNKERRLKMEVGRIINRRKKDERRKTIFIFLLVYLLSSIFYLRSVSADAIYLKNGKVMQGRIVEKSEKYLVLRSGEGESAVDSTIFLEDILKIESTQDYSREENLISSQLEKSSVFKKATSEKPFYTKIKPIKDYGAQDIKDLIAQNRRLAAENKEDKKDKERRAVSSAKSGEGSINGTITLPLEWR